MEYMAMKKRNVKKHGKKRFGLRALCSLLCAVAAVNSSVFLLTSCSSVDELGNSYSDKIEGKESADDLVADAKGKSEAISDIAYDIALMVRSEYGGKTYDLGIKNSYFATDRGTDSSNIFCTKTYYGSEGNVIDAYYRHDGYMFVDFCNTWVRAATAEKDFYAHVEKQQNTASTEYFNTASFAEGVVYEYEDGTKAAVYTSPSEELTKSVAVFLGLEGNYVYKFSDIYLRCNVKTDGTVSACRLDFMLEYHEEGMPDAVVVCDGEFACTVNATGEAVSVRTPGSNITYTTVSEISKLDLLLNAYQVLGSYTGLSVDYYRKVQNGDNAGNRYMMSNEATFTQSYKDGVYTYGSIDEEKGEIEKTVDGEKDLTKSHTSVGIFIDKDGKYHYRDLTGKKEDKTMEGSVEEWLTVFAGSIKGVEARDFWLEEAMSSLKITEDGETITFAYAYSADAVPAYATYLLDAFSAKPGSVDIGNQKVTAGVNKGVVKIRLSDGCLMYHKIEFDALIGLTVEVSGEFELTVNSTDREEFDVLDLEDWARHENKLS